MDNESEIYSNVLSLSFKQNNAVVHFNIESQYPTYPSFHLPDDWNIMTLKHYVSE